MKELPAMVWGLRTQPSRNTGVSSYFMVFGVEAVLPTNIKFGSTRVEHFDQSSVDVAEPPELYGPHAPIIVLKTSDYRT